MLKNKLLKIKLLFYGSDGFYWIGKESYKSWKQLVTVNDVDMEDDENDSDSDVQSKSSICVQLSKSLFAV